MEKYQNSRLSSAERARDLLGKMDIDEKLGQLTGYLPAKDSTPQDLAERYPYGVGQISALEMRTISTMEDAAAFQRAFQTKAMECSAHHIPAVFHMEGLCGIFVQGATSFPSGVGRGASFDHALEFEIGKTVGRQAAAMGFSQVLAPVLDVTADARFGRSGESYGEDATLVSAMGVQYVKGLQGDSNALHPESAAKHFLAFHKGQGGMHESFVELGGRQLREVFAKPFQAAISEACLRGIMPCYNEIDNEPVSGSSHYLRDLLRGEMGFDGVTVSDYSAVEHLYDKHRVCETKTMAGERAVKAGMDVELPNSSCYNDELKEKIKTDKELAECIDEAVLRVLEAKFRMGLFEQPFAQPDDLIGRAFRDKKVQELSLRSAREGIVLLKNDGILPLKKVKKIAVIGWHGGTARAYFGGYTHFSMAEGYIGAMNTMAGTGEICPFVATDKVPKYHGSNIAREDNSVEAFEALLRHICPHAKSLAAVLRERLPETEVTYSYGYPYIGDEEGGFAEALCAAKDADVVLVTLGGKHGTGLMSSTGENIDSMSVNLPVCQERFLEELAKLNKPCVGIHFDGRPISSDVADRVLNAIVEAWNPSEFGGDAVYDVLTGAYCPSGKLPVSVGYTAGQFPVRYDRPYGSLHNGDETYAVGKKSPRYVFGYGLSYTSFSYGDLTAERTEIGADEPLVFAFSVQNTGAVYGEEIAQVYVRDEYACMIRPDKFLAGFIRIGLFPGEKKRVHFVLHPSQTAFLNGEMQWLIERGEFTLMVGGSSEDIRLQEKFRISESKIIDGKERRFYAEVKF